MAVMAREVWTDERLDDLNARVGRLENRMDSGFAEMRQEFVAVRAEMKQEFRAIRLASLAFFENLPAAAWMRSGIASGNPFTVRALAYILAGHVAHHQAILRERYL